MDFKRKKKRGFDQKTWRLWLSQDGYRIVWRREVFGVSTPASYQACVRVLIPGNFDGGNKVIWDFVNHDKRLYKTMNAAVAECEKHQQLWQRVTECKEIQAVCKVLGRWPFGVPEWVTEQMDKHVLALLMDNKPRRKHKDVGLAEEKPTKKLEEKSAEEPKGRKTRSDKGKKRVQENRKGLYERHRQHLCLRRSATD